jgi:hypothetical protein
VLLIFWHSKGLQRSAVLQSIKQLPPHFIQNKPALRALVEE